MAYPPLPVDKQYAGHPQIPARGVPLLLGVTDIPETFLPLTDHLGGDHDALHEPAALDFGATDLALVFGGNRSRGYDDGEADGLQQQQAQGLKVQEPFCLAPGVDTAGLKMTWRVHGKTNFASAKLELFASGVAEPIWKKRWGGAWGAEDAAIDTFQADRVGDTASFQGELPWTDVQLDPGAYPDGLLTVKGSPYQLRLTLSAKKAEADPEDLDLVAYPMTAWTFFHVAVHSFTYKFGPPDWLSKDRPDITDEHREKVVGTRAAGNGGAIDYGLEGAVLEELRQAAHPGQDQTQAKLKATSFHQVNLTANFNSKRGRSSDSAAWGERWGHGPRLPLLAYAWIRKNDGGHTDAHVDKVLAGARLLWDWQESSPDRWKQATQTETHGGGDVTRQWLGNLLQQHNGAAVPQGSSNCPAVFGGKVGGAQPVFLPQPTAGNGKGSLPFKVTPCQTRTHAAVSEFDATGKTGVLFQPSRMAGDHYVVRSYLYTGDHLDSLADLEAADVAKGSPGTFEVHKRVHVHHLVLTDLPGVAVNDLVETVRVRASAQAYLDLQVTTVAPTGTAYDTLRKEALKRLGAKSLNNAFLNFELVHLLAPGHPGSSLIKTVGFNPFQVATRDAFRRGKLRRVKAAGLSVLARRERVTGTGGKTGSMLPLRVGGQEALFVLSDVGQPAFTDGEQVTGVSTGEQWALAYDGPGGSCWETDVTFQNTNNKKDKSVVVTFPDASQVTLSFKDLIGSHSALDRKQRQQLKDGIAAAVAAFGDGDKFEVKVSGYSGSSSSSKRRIANVIEEIEEQLLAGGIPNRDTLHGVYRTASPLHTSWADQLKETTPIFQPLCEAFAAAYLEQRGLTEGIVVTHASRISNLAGTPMAQGKGSRGANFLDYPTGGWADGSIPAHKDAGLIYLVTPQVGAPTTLALQAKGFPSIFLHELAHALCLPHAPHIEGRRGNPGNAERQLHVTGENCLMNYDPESNQFCGLCMLRLRGWDYKSLMNAGGMTPPTVTLRLGDLDRMFTAPATELLGKQERLQALGMFNRPLSLRKRAYWQAEYDAAWDYSWEFAKTKLPGLDADPAGVLRRELARYLVDEGTLPSPGESKKVRRWAGFGPWFGKADIALRYGVGYVPDAPEHTFKMNAVRADLEAIYEHANPALGALPLAVEVKTGEEPIAGVQVWFELLAPAADRTPYDAAFAGRRVAGATSFVKGTGRPEAHASCVEWWTQRIYDHKANARQAGPQRQNVHFELGGKADMAPDGDVVTPVNNLRNVFSPPAGGGQAVLAKAYLPNQPNHVPNTAVAITDSNGVATVLFTPSAIGGERYRLRVTVRDPRDVAQVLGQAESGDMVVWRGFRVCAYYQRPAAAKERDITALVRQSIVEGRAQDNLKDLVGVLPTLDLKKSVQFEMAKAYCDVLIDDEGLAPRPLDAAYWTRYHDYIDQAYVANPDITRVPALSQRLAPYKVDLVSNDNLTFTGTLAPLPIRKGTVIILPRTAAEDKLAVAHDWQDGMDLTAGQADLVGVNLDDKVMGFATKMRVVANTTPIANGRIDYTTGAVTVTFQAAQVGAQFSAAWHPERPVDYRALHTHPPASPFLFSLVGRDEYNHLKGPSYPPADPINPNGLTVWQTLVGEVGEGSIAGTMLLRAASGAALEINGRTNGQCFAPGLIIIQAWRDNVYSLAGGDLGGKGVGNAALVYSGVAAKNKKALQAAHHHYLTLHEAGHAMYMIHAPQEAGSDSGLHSSNVDKHGCVMGGQDFDPKGARVNHGGFCGKCLANFAGVHIQEEPLRMERNTANQPIGNAPKGSIALARAQGIPGDIPDVDTHPVVTTVTTGGGTDEKPPLPPEEVRPNPDW